MHDIAIGIFCKTPAAGLSKTRLSPPLRPEECAALSACFIRDVAATIAEVAHDGRAIGYAVYTPAGSEAELRALLPPGFRLLPQCEGDFGTRVAAAVRELLAAHAGVILVNADSPTLPASILRAAVDATRQRRRCAQPCARWWLHLVGLSEFPEQLFTDVPWSTAQVHQTTVTRAQEIGLHVTNVPGWYDVDDAQSLALLQRELAGEPLPFAPAGIGAPAPATRSFFARRR